jgi:integrase
MAAQKRLKTDYPGVFYRESKRVGGPGTEKVYYAVFKVLGKVVEEAVGRQFKDNMTPAKANKIRGKLIEGTRLTRQAKKIEEAKKKWTFNELWQEYEKNKAPTRSFQTDLRRFEKYLKSPFGDKEPKQLIMMDVERVRLQMNKFGRAPQTIKHVLALLKRLGNFGANQGICQPIPFKVSIPQVDNKVTEDLTPEELDRLLTAIENDTNKAVATMMKLALFTGMRKGEIFKLQWNDVNFHRGYILIRNPKGGNSQEIPLNKEAKNLLNAWSKTEDSPYVFPGKNGGQRVTISTAARKIREAAGLPNTFRPMHGLRHVYASMLASSGKVDMYTLQKLLTHKSPVMTQRYAHLRDDTLKRAADLAGDIIGTAMQNNSQAQSDIVKIGG